MADLPATLVEDIDALRRDRRAGAFDYVPSIDEPKGMRFICPCGCGGESYMAFEGHGSPGPTWTWDGNRERPTLTPSVFNTGMPCRWHGFLTAGVWRPC